MSVSEVLAMFVTADGEGNVRNIPEWPKIM